MIDISLGVGGGGGESGGRARSEDFGWVRIKFT